jgi:hypothetical protein
VVACLVTGALLVGCQTEDRARLAAAKCGLPLAEAVLGEDPMGAMPQRTGVQVKDLGDGRYRVTGMVLVEGSQSVTGGGRRSGAGFVCEVTPDPSDELRGFKVTRLEVDELRLVR